jgi:cytochrome P450
LGSRFRFIKPVEWYRTLEWFGVNLVTADEVHWTRHRKISAPAFTERNVALVCQRSVDMVEGLIGQNLELLKFDDVTTLTIQVSKNFQLGD